jgi:hypothetical protein
LKIGILIYRLSVDIDFHSSKILESITNSIPQLVIYLFLVDFFPKVHILLMLINLFFVFVRNVQSFEHFVHILFLWLWGNFGFGLHCSIDIFRFFIYRSKWAFAHVLFYGGWFEFWLALFATSIALSTALAHKLTTLP